METIPVLIRGIPYTAKELHRFPVINNEEQKQVLLAESADAEVATLAAEAAWEAFQTWKNSTAVHRRRLLLRYSEILRSSEEELVASQRLETSVSELWARKNVHLAADLIEEVATCITRLQGEIPTTQVPGSLALALVAPVGPVFSIAPWNSSVILGARAIATPVGAGCTVVFKASELCPKTHHLLVKLFKKAGLPDGVVNVIQAHRENAVQVTEALIAHHAIRKIEFIGSDAVGRHIGKLAGQHLKPVLMELGGKGAAIVLHDADLEDAAEKCVTGAFLHHGQLCFSTERVIVVEVVATEFEKHLKDKAAGFKPGNSASSKVLTDSLEKLKDAEAKGAGFLVGGPERASISALKQTIITGVTEEMLISDEESFGPSLTLIVAKDDHEAIQIANRTKFGLNAAVHSQNMEHALRVAREIDTAQVHVNNMTAYDEPTLPVGAVKGSGWGRNNAMWGLKEFVDVKLITFNSKDSDFLKF